MTKAKLRKEYSAFWTDMWKLLSSDISADFNLKDANYVHEMSQNWDSTVNKYKNSHIPFEFQADIVTAILRNMADIRDRERNGTLT